MDPHRAGARGWRGLASEQRLDELDQLIRQSTDRELRRDLQEQQSNLLDLRDAEREEAPNVSLRYDDAGWFEDAWAAAGEEVEQQRAVLDDAMERIWVRRGGTGRRTEEQVLARLTFDWKVARGPGAGRDGELTRKRIPKHVSDRRSTL